MADEETKRMNERTKAHNKWLETENRRIETQNAALRAQAAQLQETNDTLSVEYARSLGSQGYNHANFYTPENRPSASQRHSRTESTGSTPGTTSFPPAPPQQGRR